MFKKNFLSVGGATCLIAGTLAISANTNVAYAAADCLSGPNRPSGPGTHWHYRINQTTHQRCWYLKKVGGPSRPRPSAETRTRRSQEASATPSRVAAPASEARARPAEVAAAAPAESESSIKAWFTATFSALSGTVTSKTVATEPVTSEPAPRKQRSNDAERSGRTKSERSEQTKTARAQQRSSSSAEAASNKAAVEAAGDKDVTPPPSDREPEWQRELYEEFLQWRVKQLLFE